MHEDNGSDAGSTLAEARRVGQRTREASRWFVWYLILMGVVAFAWIVALEVFFPTGGARGYTAAAGSVAMGLLAWWAESHDVYPQGATRSAFVAAAVWFGSYLLIIGPLVRWQAGDSLGWWSAAAAVMASPFFIAAWRERRRS